MTRMTDLERYGIPDPQESTDLHQLLEALETPWTREGFKPPVMERAAQCIKELMKDKQRCTQPCTQLVSLFATVERLEGMMFRLQEQCTGMETILTGLEYRR